MGRLFWRPARYFVGLTCLLVGVVVWNLYFSPDGGWFATAGTPKPLAKPPEGQKFIGAKQCSSCHFDQFLDWRQTKHAKALDVLPAKYHNDASCLKCHTTGHGEESGFKDIETTPGLVGA